MDAGPAESDTGTMGLNKLGQQQTFAPSALVHHGSGYDAMDELIENSSLHDSDLQVDQPLKMPASTAEFSVQANDHKGLADQK